jgi:uncharacterized protein (DUF1499 family)
MHVVKLILIVLAAAVVLLVLAGQLGFLRGKAPLILGVQDGKLKPPSKTPNSVTSQAALWPGHPQQTYADIAPLAWVGGDGEGTLVRAQAAISAMPGSQVIKLERGYLHATFTTPLLKFTDDLELWLDHSAGVLQVRSASRVGRKDFGVNRARVERLRALLQASAPP